MLELILLTLKYFRILLQEIIFGFFNFINFWRKKSKKNIKGQLALVTGSGRGLGKIIANKLAQQGCHLAICDINFEEAQRTCDEIKQTYSISCASFKADVSDTKAVEKLYEDIKSELGVVDILVNNAGILAPLGVLEGHDSDISRVININLVSHFWMVRKFLPDMIKQKRGHILGISSAAAKSTIPFAGAYCASKYGLIGFYNSLFDDLCVYEYDEFIKITVACPGFINTRSDLKDFLDQTSKDIPRVEPDYAANQIINALLYEKREIVFPLEYIVFPLMEYVLPSKIIQLVKIEMSKNGKASSEKRLKITRA